MTKGECLKDLTQIISGLEQQQSAIQRAISALREIYGSGSGSAPAKKRGRPGRPTGSGAAAAPKKAAPAKRKRRLSAEGRQAIIEALKKRWAEKRAGENPATKNATKKGRKKAAPPPAEE